MIHFENFILANGLRVIVHQDLSTPMAVMNIMYVQEMKIPNVPALRICLNI